MKEPNVLRGLPGVEVVVESLGDTSLVDLDNAALRADVEAELDAVRIARLPPGSEGAILYLNVDLLPGKGGSDLVAGLELQLLENAWLDRSRDTRVLAATWDEGVVLATQTGDVAYVRDAVRSLVSRFIDAYHGANAAG